MIKKAESCVGGSDLDMVGSNGDDVAVGSKRSVLPCLERETAYFSFNYFSFRRVHNSSRLGSGPNSPLRSESLSVYSAKGLFF